MKFSDGTPMNADAVKFSIERTMASGNVGAVRAELLQIASITVTSPTKLTIALKTPIAGQFYNLLANGETFVVSPTAAQSGTSLDEKPVGAGPFTLESFTPERSAKFVKNPNYFEAKKIKIGGHPARAGRRLPTRRRPSTRCSTTRSTRRRAASPSTRWPRSRPPV